MRVLESELVEWMDKNFVNFATIVGVSGEVKHTPETLVHFVSMHSASHAVKRRSERKKNRRREDMFAALGGCGERFMSRTR